MHVHQVLFGRYLATWIAQCSAAAVRLQLTADAEADDDDDDDADQDEDDGDFFLLAVCTPCEQYGEARQDAPNCPKNECLQLCRPGECCRSWVSFTQAEVRKLCAAEDVFMEREAPYKLGSKDLLDAVKGPCQERGIRCTDVNGTGDVLLFERL